MEENKKESAAEVVDFLCTSRECPYYIWGCKLPGTQKKDCPKKGSFRRKPRINIDDLLVVVDGEGY